MATMPKQFIPFALAAARPAEQGFRLPFPVDMLRYDQCYAYSLGTTGFDYQPVLVVQGLIAPSLPKRLPKPHWTLGRWESFGWVLQPEPIERRELMAAFSEPTMKQWLTFQNGRLVSLHTRLNNDATRDYQK